MLTAIVVAFNGITVAVMLFAFARNEWVMHVRDRVLATDEARWLRLASYEAMLGRFWVWDVAEFEGAA